MSYIGNPINSVAFLTDQFSGNGGTTFTMSVAPATTSSVLVAVHGVIQDPSTYSVVGTTLTFSAAPPTGTGNISVRYLGIPATGVATTAYRTVTDNTAIAGQTTFSVPSYTVGYINVFQNGVRLGAADFTATNGTTVVLTVAAAAGDLITTESFYVSSVLNAIANTNGSVTQLNLAPNVAGNGPAFFGYLNGNQASPTTGVWTKVALDMELFDTNNNFSSGKFQPSVAGYYQINGLVHFAAGASSLTAVAIYKNGSVYSQGTTASTVLYALGHGGIVVYMNGSTDYIELYVYVSTTTAILAGSICTSLSGSLVRAA
jgi:hypothetical protein